MSYIFLKDLVVEAKHGIHEHERTNTQRFRFNIELEINTPDAFTADTIESTISYSDIRKNVIHIVTSKSFQLLERLAQVICDELLGDKRIRKISLTIEKLDVYPDTIPGIRVIRSND